jgi:hypothetical protein
VEEADLLRPCAARNRKPVNQAEHRGEKPAHDSPRDVPVGYGGEGRRSAPEVHGIEDDRGDEEAQGQDDEHWVNGVSEELGSALHSPNSFSVFENSLPSFVTARPRMPRHRLGYSNSPI